MLLRARIKVFECLLAFELLSLGVTAADAESARQFSTSLQSKMRGVCDTSYSEYKELTYETCGPQDAPNNAWWQCSNEIDKVNRVITQWNGFVRKCRAAHERSSTSDQQSTNNKAGSLDDMLRSQSSTSAQKDNAQESTRSSVDHEAESRSTAASEAANPLANYRCIRAESGTLKCDNHGNDPGTFLYGDPNNVQGCVCRDIAGHRVAFCRNNGHDVVRDVTISMPNCQ